MASELEIKATLDAVGVTKGIDDVNNQLQSLEANAKKAGEAGAEGAQKWQSALESLKTSMPKEGEAAGMSKVADATKSAGDEAGKAQGAFSKLGDSLKQMGGSIWESLKGAFAGIADKLSGMGELAGKAFMLALRAGMLAVNIGVALAAAVGYAVYKMYGIAEEGGKRWMQTFTNAFAAGMDISQFNAIKAGLTAFLPDEKDQAAIAAAIGKMGNTLLEGGKKAERLQEILKRTGVDFEALRSGGLSTATELQKAFEAISKLNPQQQTAAWKALFEGVPVDQLAKLVQGLRQAGLMSEEMANKILSAQTKLAGQMQIDKALGDAARNVQTAWGEVKKAFDETFGITDKVNYVMGTQIPAILAITANAMRAFAGIVRQLPQAWEDLKQKATDAVDAVRQAWEDMGQAIVSAIEGNRAAIVAAFQQTIDAITGVWDGLVAKVQAVLDAISAKIKAWADTAKSYVQPVLDMFNSAKGWIPGLQSSGSPNSQRAYPLQSTYNNLLRAAGPSSPQAFGFVAAPHAANDNATTVGGLTSSQWDSLLFNYKEYDKVKKSVVKTTQLEKAANDQLTSGLTSQNTALSAMLSQLGLTEAELRDWVVQTALATEGSDQWADAQLRLKAALQAGMLSTEQYAAAFERLKEKFDTGPMQTAINDLKSGMQSFADTAASSFADAIVNGEDLSEVFKNLAKQLASMLLQALVLKPLFGGLFGTSGGGVGLFGAQAVAGNGVSSLAQPSAMFRAGTTSALTGLSNFAGRTGANVSGSQTVNQQVKSEITVNTGTGETAVSANQGVEFGRKLEAAVQQVLVKEQRPGGTLWRRSAA